ncbi:hypothetical protein DFH06DRAFT_1208386 [Mycena polygramma]|nr:hypothetical protein DFH06DRAFT_1208386 [Mycena polygramma]
MLERLDDSMQVDTIEVGITQVNICLRGIAALGVLRSIPQAAFVDLWHRVWPWIEFLDQYGDNLPGIDDLAVTNMYRLYMALFRVFRGDDQTNMLMDSTGGPHLVAGTAWRHLIHSEEREGFADVSYFLAMWSKDQMWHPVAFEALVTGAGGTRMDLASLVLAHLQRLVSEKSLLDYILIYGHISQYQAVRQKTSIYCSVMYLIAIPGYLRPDRPYMPDDPILDITGPCLALYCCAV